MKIRTVALLGAGAIGSYFIAGFAEEPGIALWTVAEGERPKTAIPAACGSTIHETGGAAFTVS